MSELLQKMSEILAQNFLFATLIAFAAGTLTVFTPCSLTTLPMIVSYMNGTGSSKRKAFIYSALICLGQAIVFVLMGFVAASLGYLINKAGFHKFWHILLALITFWMALEMFGITHVLHKGNKPIKRIKNKGFIGAIGIGLVTALFATPCSTPVFTAMLAYVSTVNLSILYGGLLLLGYALGHSIPLVIAGTSLSFVQSLSNSEKFAKISKTIKIVFGVLLLALTAYLIIAVFYE